MTANIKRADYQRVMEKGELFFKKSGCSKSPPVDLNVAAERLGIDVRYHKLQGDVSGFLFLDKMQDPIIGINIEHPPTRQRFTLAHEIGHFFLHAPPGGSGSFIDKGFTIVKRDTRSQMGVVVEEIEANFFAAEILMPAEHLYPDFVSSSSGKNPKKELDKLADKYDVSVEAMEYRLRNLGFM